MTMTSTSPGQSEQQLDMGLPLTGFALTGFVPPKKKTRITHLPLDVAFCPLRFQISGSPEDWVIREIAIDGMRQPANPCVGTWMMPRKLLSIDVVYVGAKPDGETFSCVALGILRPTSTPSAGSRPKVTSKTTDPMNALHDGVALRDLLAMDEIRRREEHTPSRTSTSRSRPTPAQRSAISAHWSALLRAKAADAARADRDRVRVDLDDVE